MILMDENVDKALKQFLEPDDYEMVLKMLETMEDDAKKSKDAIRKILEDAIDG